MSEKKKFTLEQAKEYGDKLGTDWKKFDVDQFYMGMNVELEHGSRDPLTNVTNNDLLITAKIALAHLIEFPDYYTRLKKLETEAKDYWKNKQNIDNKVRKILSFDNLILTRTGHDSSTWRSDATSDGSLYFAQKTYTINISRTDPRSKNNFLFAIALSAGELAFNKDTGKYTVVVENNVTSITIGGTVADAKSVLTGPGTFDLKIYSNVFVLSITAENQTVRTYTLDIVRKDELGFSRELSKDNSLATLTLEGVVVPFAPETTQYVLSVETAVASLNITATSKDAAAKVEFVTPAALDLNQNVINVTVTAENGEKRVYVLFVYRKSEALVVSIDEILATLDTTTAKSVILVPSISGIIPKAVLDKAAEKGIVLIVEKKDEAGRVIQVWTFTGVAADTRTNIDTNLNFASIDEEAIRKISNYADGIILNFNHNGAIVAGTTVKIYVGKQFADGLKLNLYLFNKEKNKLGLEVKEIEVKKGFVELTMTHASQYFLTRSTFKDTSLYSVLFIASIVEAGLILSLLVYMFLRRRRKPAKLDK